MGLAFRDRKRLVARHVELARALLRVLRNVHENRTRTAALRNIERFTKRGRDLFSALYQIVMFRDREGDAGDVGFLKSVGAKELAADLAGDANDRRGVHRRRGNASYHVRRAGTRGRHRYTNSSAGARVSISHVCSALLVANQHMMNLRILAQSVVRRKDCAAGISEDVFYIFGDQAFPNNLRTGSHSLAPY